MHSASTIFSNSGAKRSMIRCGSGHSRLSVMSPNCTPPAYDRIDTPTPMSPDCGTQTMMRRILRARHVQRLLRSGHVGHHRRGLAREEVERLLLQLARRQPDHAEEPTVSTAW